MPVLITNWKPPTLETARLILRPVCRDDAPAVFLYASNERLTRWTLWSTHQTIDDSRHYVGSYAESRCWSREPEPLGIVLKNDPTNSLIGTIGCFWVSRQDEVMELGYNLAEPYWGRGIIAEAGEAMIDHVFETFSVMRLQARIFKGNEASMRVAEKLGMTYEGTLRSSQNVRGTRHDILYYSLLRSEHAAWRSKRQSSS